MSDFPRYTADGLPVRPPDRCRHKFRVGECRLCDVLRPPPTDFRELVQAHKPEPAEEDAP